MLSVIGASCAIFVPIPAVPGVDDLSSSLDKRFDTSRATSGQISSGADVGLPTAWRRASPTVANAGVASVPGTYRLRRSASVARPATTMRSRTSVNTSLPAAHAVRATPARS